MKRRKTGTLQPNLAACLSLLLLPNHQLVRFFPELLAEIRVGDGNQRIPPLPNRLAPEMGDAVLRHHIHGVHPGIRHHGAILQGRPYAGMQRAVLVRVGGAETDKALAALG